VKTVQMPRWVAICLAMSVVATLCFTALALTSYTLVKPFTLANATASCPFTVDSVSFSYDPETNQYPQCTLTVSNTGTSPMSATVHVILKDAGQNIVASGQLSQMFTQGATAVTVTLSWVSGKTVDAVSGGYITVQPS